MRIVIDTNVVISGVFFGGLPGKILLAVVYGKIDAYANTEIIAEYDEIIEEMISRKQGSINTEVLKVLINKMKIIDINEKIDVCRDPEDNKFIGCAKDAKAAYIVSGDKDLLVLEKIDDIEIVTAKDFYDRHLK